MGTTSVVHDLVFGDHGMRAGTLDRLPDGECCRIAAVTGDAAVRRRLLEMGLCVGTEVRAVRRAPLGDPLEVLVRGYHLSLRREQAAAIIVSAA